MFARGCFWFENMSNADSITDMLWNHTGLSINTWTSLMFHTVIQNERGRDGLRKVADILVRNCFLGKTRPISTFSVTCAFFILAKGGRGIKPVSLIMQIEVKSVLYLFWQPLIKFQPSFLHHFLPCLENNDISLYPLNGRKQLWVQWPHASLSQGCLYSLPVCLSSGKHCHTQHKIMLKCCVVL